MPEAGECLCPRCGARMPAATAPCPRCGNVYSARSRQAQIEALLNRVSPLDVPPTGPHPAAGQAPLPQERPGSFVPAAEGTPPSPAALSASPPAPESGGSRRGGRRRRIGVILLLACALLAAVGYGIYQWSLGYHASPERLVEGLNAALKSRDEDLLLTLLPPEERELYSRAVFTSFYLDSTRDVRRLELVDVFIGEQNRYADVVIRQASSGSRDCRTIIARRVDGKWYFPSSSLVTLPYFEESGGLLYD